MSPALRAVLLWLGMVGVALLPLPAETMAAAIGATYGPWKGPLMAWSAALTGASISYWLARRLGRNALERFLPKSWMESLDAFSHKARGPGPLTLMRLIPVIPFTAINWGCGLTHVPFRRFFATTAVGLLPGAFVFCWTGAGLLALAKENPAAAIGITAGLGAAALIFKAVRTRRFKTHAAENPVIPDDPEDPPALD